MGSPLKRLAVLGSTGSIGQQTLDIVRSFPDRFQIIALAAGGNRDLLDKQIAEFRPRFTHSRAGGTLSPEEMAAHSDVDLVVIAISGNAGLLPTLAAVKAGKPVALANKESLVTAGGIITAEAARTGAALLPVDSEHSAIWQCLVGEKATPARLILTASGGPFRGYSLKQLAGVTAAQALKHPSWQMGPKVTIDSATLMNKGLEVIEAHWLFKLPFERIDVLVHPQSYIHSMVEFADGAIKAQLGYPDMRLPIQYALSYPERLPNERLPRLDLGRLKSMTFDTPDFTTFRCPALAIEAGRKGGTYPAVLSAADEAAVELFLAGRIRFTDIARLVEGELERHTPVARPTIDDIVATTESTRERVLRVAGDTTWTH